ncbi:ArnT family glycosyltransferase [Halobellus ordinarius]|uniref:ArnT family glycosyltransferase n=1 Tax=Halobellus ordinarius TaxID=3075120 RepID=UPI0028803BDA|nr:glycosyltransferase family 39 protein [Halobellus sp. ZY16]
MNEDVKKDDTTSAETSSPGGEDVGHSLRQQSSVSWVPTLSGREIVIGNLWFLSTFVVLLLGFSLLYLDQPLHFDEAIFLTIGEQIASGETLYADIADHKPPGIFVLAAAVYRLPGDPVIIARLFTYAITGVSGLLVVRLGREFCSRRAAQGAGILFIVMSFLPHFDGFYYLTEPYVVFTLLVAAVLLGYDTLLAKAAVGVALGVGVLFNQTVFLFGATIILFYAIRLRYPDRRTRRYVTDSITEILAIGVGFLATMAVVLLVLASQGIVEETIYYSFVLPLTSYNTQFNYYGHALAFATLLPILLLAGGVLVNTGVSVVRGDRVDERFLFVVLWAGILSIPAIRAFSGDHKFLFAFPALALLAVTGLIAAYRKTLENSDQLLRLPRVPDRSALISGLIVAVVLSTAVVSGGGNVYYGSLVVDDNIQNERDAVVPAVEGLDGPMYAYNVQAQLYVHTDVEPGTSYIGTIYSEDLARNKISSLERNEVRYVLVREYEVSGDEVVASGYWSGHKSIMTEYLNENYEPVRHTEEYVVFERTSGS